jgi:hypothetical protein
MRALDAAEDREKTSSQICLGSTDECGQIFLVLAPDILQNKHRCGLLVNDGPQSRFAFHNDVWHTHLAAQSRQVYNQLDWVNVMSNDDKRRLLGFDEGNCMVQTVFDEDGLLCLLGRVSKYGHRGQ